MQYGCRSLFALIRDMVRKKGSAALEEEAEENSFEQVWRKSAAACMRPDMQPIVADILAEYCNNRLCERTTRKCR